MTKGQLNDALRYALTRLDTWNDVTGQFDTNCSYWYEIQGIIEDAVHIGVQMALFGKVKTDGDNNIVTPDMEEKEVLG